MTGLFPVKTNNITRDSDGAHLTAANSYIEWNYRDLANLVVDIEFGDCVPSISGTNHGRLLISVMDSKGLVLRNNSYWAFYNGSWSSSYSTDKELFKNATVRMVYSSTGDRVDFYINGVAFALDVAFGGHSTIIIGGSGLAFYSIVVKKMKIMSKAYAGVT